MTMEYTSEQILEQIDIVNEAIEYCKSRLIIDFKINLKSSSQRCGSLSSEINFTTSDFIYSINTNESKSVYMLIKLRDDSPCQNILKRMNTDILKQIDMIKLDSTVNSIKLFTDSVGTINHFIYFERKHDNKVPYWPDSHGWGTTSNNEIQNPFGRTDEDLIYNSSDEFINKICMESREKIFIKLMNKHLPNDITHYRITSNYHKLSSNGWGDDGYRFNKDNRLEPIYLHYLNHLVPIPRDIINYRTISLNITDFNLKTTIEKDVITRTVHPSFNVTCNNELVYEHK